MQWSGSGTTPNTSTGGDFAFMTTNKAGASLMLEDPSMAQMHVFQFNNDNNLAAVESIIDDDFKYLRELMVNAGYTFNLSMVLKVLV